MTLQNREQLWREMVDRFGLSTPADGVPLDDERWAYKARKSSLAQAKHWNDILEGHPVYDPGVCGFVVGAGRQRVNGYFPLVWERPPIGDAIDLDEPPSSDAQT